MFVARLRYQGFFLSVVKWIARDELGYLTMGRILTCKPMESRENFLASFSIGFGKFLGAYSTGVSHRLNETLFKHFAYTRESESFD